MIDHLRKGAPERLENLSAVPFESLPLSLHKQKAPLSGTIQSVEKVAVRHFFENYGVCLSH